MGEPPELAAGLRISCGGGSLSLAPAPPVAGLTEGDDDEEEETAVLLEEEEMTDEDGGGRCCIPPEAESAWLESSTGDIEPSSSQYSWSTEDTPVGFLLCDGVETLVCCSSTLLLALSSPS